MPLIEPGRKAPAFALKDQTGKVHRLPDYEGRPVILYFYPKDDTPGCTKETCSFQEYLPKFKPSKAAVLGVSILDEKSKAKFASKYGRKYMGIARTTYLIGPDGNVQKRWDNVNVNEHADEVLAALR
jgi:peroxiredoxin Q/BCP